MNRDETGRLLLGHPTRNARAPVATLRDIAAVAQALHQLCPGVGNAGETPPRFGRLVRKAKPGEGRDYDVKGFIGFTAMGRRVHQRSDDLHKFDDRSRPAMSEYEWQGILVL